MFVMQVVSVTGSYFKHILVKEIKKDNNKHV